MRYLWDDVSYVWLGQGVPEQDRFLSCSLNLTWPDVAKLDSLAAIPGQAEILATLGELFDATIIGTRAVSSRSRVEEGRFAGWLSYSSFDRSNKALQGLQHALGGGGWACGSGRGTCSSPGPGSSTARSRPGHRGGDAESFPGGRIEGPACTAAPRPHIRRSRRIRGVRRVRDCTLTCCRSGSNQKIGVVLEEGGEPQQRQPRAGRDRVLRIDSDPLAQVQPERRPPAIRILPAGDVRVQPDRRRPACNDLPADLDVPAGFEQARVDPGPFAQVPELYR